MPLPPRIAREIERPLWGPLLAYAVALASYLYTIAPTLLWGDDAKFQWMAYLRDTRAGAAYDHPVWVILAHPFTRLPVGDVAFRATLWDLDLGGRRRGARLRGPQASDVQRLGRGRRRGDAHGLAHL